MSGFRVVLTRLGWRAEFAGSCGTLGLLPPCPVSPGPIFVHSIFRAPGCRFIFLEFCAGRFVFLKIDGFLVDRRSRRTARGIAAEHQGTILQTYARGTISPDSPGARIWSACGPIISDAGRGYSLTVVAVALRNILPVAAWILARVSILGVRISLWASVLRPSGRFQPELLHAAQTLGGLAPTDSQS
jgi:hypothetical protein